MDQPTRLSAFQEILASRILPGPWRFTVPAQGQQKECYIASNGAATVFIKLDTSCPAAVLRRLGELEVAPALLDSGSLDSRAYAIFAYVSGEHPNWTWFGEHIDLIAATTRRYHLDERLAALLAETGAADYATHIAGQLEKLRQKLDLCEQHGAGRPLRAMLREAFAELARQAAALAPAPLAPIHADPNKANIILRDNTMLLVDWDEVLLSDPLRDVGQWLGWYVPQRQWAAFFQAHGFDGQGQLNERIFWWAARSSFGNVLWHIEHGYDYRVFLADTRSALDRTIVPHPVFHDDA